MLKVTQYFTGHGLWGAVLFVLGNLSGGIGWWLWSEMMLTTNAFFWTALGGAMAVALSVPLMIVGRSYDIEIKHIPKSKFQ